MAEGNCSRISAIAIVKRGKRRKCEECAKIGASLGPSSHMPGMRRDAPLRGLAERARDQARAYEHASSGRFGRVWRALALLLLRRRLQGVLTR
jgi:hypothetical protein